jgi:hypothetical protein
MCILLTILPKIVEKVGFLMYHSSMIDLFGKKKLVAMEAKLQNIQADQRLKLKKIQEENAQAIQNLQISFMTRARAHAESQQEKYAWNLFQAYETAIPEIHRMYNCESAWGITIGALIDLRAAFVGGHGVEIEQIIPDSDREKAFVEKFLETNSLNSAGFLKLLREPEKEGKCLLKIINDPEFKWTWTDKKKEVSEKGMAKIQYLSWIESGYKIAPKEWGGEVAGTAVYKNSDKEAQKITLKEPEFVYRRWRGPSNKIDKATSVFQRVIEHVVGLEKAYFDQRLNNHLFAAAKPWVKCENKHQADEMNSLLNENAEGYNIASRRIMIYVGEFKFAQPTESTMLQNEISTHRKAISFHTGIPEQFLGDSSGVRGKDLSENLMEGVDHAMEGDRQVAEDMLNELITKAIAMVNGKTTALRENAVKIRIGKITAADWNRIVAIWMPATNDGLVSRETFLERVPGLDVEQELERLEKEGEEKKKKQEENRDPLIDEMLSIDRAEKIEENREVKNADFRKENQNRA